MPSPRPSPLPSIVFLADPPDNRLPGDPIPFDQAIDQAPDRPQFPVFILAAPGLLCMLALALPDALSRSMRSPMALWVATGIAAGGAILCFAIIASRSREREVKIPAVAVLIGALLLALRAVLRLI